MSSPLLFRIAGFDFVAVQSPAVAAVKSHLVAGVGYIAAEALVVAGYYPAYYQAFAFGRPYQQ